MGIFDSFKKKKAQDDTTRAELGTQDSEERIICYNPQEIELIRASSKALFQIHLWLSALVRPGVTTQDLERRIAEMMLSLKVMPSFKGYMGFPAVAYFDVNDAVCHTPPSGRILEEGDIVKIGAGVIQKGFQADKIVTYPVGEIDDKAARLIAITNEAMWRAISQCRPENHVGDISHAIQSTIEPAGFSAVREYTGCGIGRRMHEAPKIPNFGVPGQGPLLRTGMVLNPHVLANQGAWRTRVADSWSVVSEDGSLSACATETIAIADDGPDLLTGLISSSGGGWTFPGVQGLNSNTESHDLSAHDLILGERIETVLGGGMGTVYLTERHAFKTLSSHIFTETSWNYFAREIDVWLRLPDHKNIVKAFSVVPQSGHVFLVLERIHGFDLRHFISRGNYDLPRAMEWARQICEGMAFVHSLGLLHRDLKPSNILIDKQDVAHITDFGIATILSHHKEMLTDHSFDSHSLTQVGDTVGTPAYMAPEQWSKSVVTDERSDIYSFGMLLYELVCRRHPFEPTLHSLRELSHKHLHEDPVDPREYNSAIPANLASIILKCIKKDPNQRYRDFTSILRQIAK